MLIRSFGLIPLVLTTCALVACNSLGSGLPAPTQGGQFNPYQYISPDIQGDERASVAGLLVALRDKLNLTGTKKLNVAILFPGRGNLVYANRPEVRKNLFVYRQVNPQEGIYEDSAGRLVTLPHEQPPSHVRPEVVQHTGSGPYRRIFTGQDPSGVGYHGETASVTAPCQAVLMNANGVQPDGAYAYMEGWPSEAESNSETNQIEAGLQLSQFGGGSYQVYMRVPGISGDLGYPNQGPWKSTGPDHWCTNGTVSQLAISLNLSLGILSRDLTQPAPAKGPPYGSWLCTSITPNNKCDIIFYSITTDGTLYDVVAAEVPEDGLNNQQYHDWSYKCTTCVLGRVTSIAQNVDNFTDGSTYGPVLWQSSQLCEKGSLGENCHTWSASDMPSPTTGCEDYPAWTSSPQVECSSGPPPTAHNRNVIVNYTDIADETDSISLLP